MSRTVQSLNDWWDYRIGEGGFTKKRVPYSDIAVGLSRCSLNFSPDCHDAGGRAFLVFEGITYAAEVCLNGVSLGRMLPYSRYRFEVGGLLKNSENRLDVDIFDLGLAFGPSEGWENYSGIIRDVFIEYTDRFILSDVIFRSELENDFSLARCALTLLVDGEEAGISAEVTLCDPAGRVVYSGSTAASGETKLDFSFSDPLLWSPDFPMLYTLSVCLRAGDRVCDSYTQKVGFKQLKASGKRFMLNGKPLFLVGVCRHDLYGDSGHVMTEQQMLDDMKMIKDAGANYVRLVHYPHHKRIVEIADEIGLIVSEEPGLWWSDVSNREIFDGSLEVLRRTVLRDRNNVSVGFWLSFNECKFTPEYLLAAAAVCRENDPTRMVSGANCMDIPMTKKYFSECGFDFYTMHPYAPTTARMHESARELNDNPLLLTEWGGYDVYDNPHVFSRFIHEIVELWKNPDDKPVLAGASLWYWADMYQFERADPACCNGILCEGLVDRFRRPNLNLPVFKEGFSRLSRPDPVEKSVTVTPFTLPAGVYEPVALTRADDQREAWEKMTEEAGKSCMYPHCSEWKQRVISNGPTLPEEIMALGTLPVNLLKVPLVASETVFPEICLGENAAEIYIIGNVSMPKGFPLSGKPGETAGILDITYCDGSTDSLPLANGREITTALGWFGPSRINPVASNAPRALTVINDMDREHYVVNLYKPQLRSGLSPVSMRLRAVNGYILLLYGVSAGRTY